MKRLSRTGCSGEQESNKFVIDYVSVSNLTTVTVCQEVLEGT
jgi:hypothetical protein